MESLEERISHPFGSQKNSKQWTRTNVKVSGIRLIIEVHSITEVLNQIIKQRKVNKKIK